MTNMRDTLHEDVHTFMSLGFITDTHTSLWATDWSQRNSSQSVHNQHSRPHLNPLNRAECFSDLEKT